MLSLLLSLTASGATLELCSNCAFTTMQDALDSAESGDVIEVGPGDWETDAHLGIDLTFQGVHETSRLICASGGNPLVRAINNSKVALLNLKVNACYSASAVHVFGAEVYLEDVELTNTFNQATYGTLLHVDGAAAKATVVNGTVGQLDGFGPAGVFSVVDGELTLRGGTYSRLQGPSAGRWAFVDGGTLNVFNTTVQNATIETFGMVEVRNAGELWMDGALFLNIFAQYSAAINSLEGTTVTIKNSVFDGMSASTGNGGALSTVKNTVVLVNNRFINNHTDKSGGAAQLREATTLDSHHNLWCNNSSGVGAGAAQIGFNNQNTRFDMHHDVFLANEAAQYGGGLRIYSSGGQQSVTPGISSSTFVMNRAIANGTSGHQVWNSNVAFDVRDSALFQSLPGVHLGNSTTTATRLYNGAYATTATAIQSNGSIQSGATAPVADLDFSNRAGADCSNALSTLRAVNNGQLHASGIGALFVEDVDGDGHNSEVDCNDNDPNIHPGQDEQCDDIDHDCDGDPRTASSGTVVDLDDAWRDVDSDGYGDDEHPGIRTICPDDFLPPGWVRRLESGGAADCNDSDPLSNPAAEERCDDDGADFNCDGEPDDGASDTTSYYADDDRDGIGDTDVVLESCGEPDLNLWSATPGDCADDDDQRFPGNDELCDDIDHDCDDDPHLNAIDPTPYFPDTDRDGHGDETASAVDYCVNPGLGWAADQRDCNDSNFDVHPDAEESCDVLDRNCDDDPTAGATDGTPYFPDTDDDNRGDESAEATTFCTNPGVNWSTNQDDCDDTDAKRFRGNIELCDPIDRDCDGDLYAGASDGTPYFPDDDNDGRGDESLTSTDFCQDPGDGWSINQNDCDDSNIDRYYGNIELCDPLDRDCDGDPINDPADAVLAFVDGDADGFGDVGTGTATCDPPEGTVDNDQDCDDTNDTIYPDAPEHCNEVDDDCDGDTDEGCETDSGDTGNPDSGDPDTGDTSVLTPIPVYTVVSGGCSTSPWSGGSWAGVLLLPFLLRRRMR